MNYPNLFHTADLPLWESPLVAAPEPASIAIQELPAGTAIDFAAATVNSATGVQSDLIPLPTTGAGQLWESTAWQFPVLAPAADQNDRINIDVSPRLGKVLHIINGEHFSGAERVQQLLGLRLGEFGVESEFACVKPDRFPQLCGLESSRVSLMPMRGRMDFRTVGQLCHKALSEGFDLLHAHTPRTALVTSAVAMRTGLPWCYHVHSPTVRDSTRPLVNQINQWIERFALRTCNRLIAVSESLRQEMLRQGAEDRKICVVPNGVPALKPIDAGSRLDSTNWRLGLVALMRPRKGIEVALHTMAALRRSGHLVDLELIGSFETTAYQQQILQMIRDLGLQESVVWSGFTRDVPSALQRLDGLLLPSLFGEGMPMVVLEALAAGIPVVATRVEGTPEVIRDSMEGFLAKPNDVESLAGSIKALISDRRRWLRMSQAALARHRSRFTDVLMAQRTAEVYADLLPVSATSVIV
jgi:glycosyltransferase involved in cell wall biosynthesis